MLIVKINNKMTNKSVSMNINFCQLIAARGKNLNLKWTLFPIWPLFNMQTAAVHIIKKFTMERHIFVYPLKQKAPQKKCTNPFHQFYTIK
jgi:hypothetical protein